MSMITSPEQAEQHDRDIAVRAYERWIRRGRPTGDGLEDWFAAQAEIEAERGRRSHDQDVAIFDA